jgi:general secretion pathway protein G
MSDFPGLLMAQHREATVADMTKCSQSAACVIWFALLTVACAVPRGTPQIPADVAFEPIKERTVLQRLRAARKNESGFTLVELLIVIIILGVLAAIVVFSVQAFQNRGESAACKTDFKTVESALEAYYAQTYHYPAAETDLTANGYLKELPPAVAGGSYYIVYTHVAAAAGPPAVTESYTLVATGACQDHLPNP